MLKRVLYLGGALALLAGSLAGSLAAQTSATDSDTTRLQLQRAYDLLRQQRPEEALEILEPILASPQADSEALYLGGLAMLAGGRNGEAMDLFERSLAANPDSPAARRLGTLRGATGRYSECLRLLRDWFEAHPDDIEAGSAAAYCALELQRAEDAAQVIDKLPSDLPATRLLRGRLLTFEAKPQEAIGTLLPALDQATGSLELDIRGLLAEAYLAVGEAGEAVEVLKNFARTEGLALLLSEAQFQNGSPGDAIETLSPWAERSLDGPRSSDTATVLTDYGRLLIQEQRPDEAVRYLSRATEVSPTSKQPWRLLGQAYTTLSRPEDARVALERFQSLVAAEPRESIKDGQARRALTDPTGKVLDDARRLATEGRVGAALQLLADESALVPDDARPVIVAATVLRREGQLQQALQAADQAVQIEPESPLTHLERGRCLAALGQLEAATTSLRESLRLHPDFVPALVDLATIELTSGNEAEARELLNRTLELEPGNARVREMLRTIGSGEN